MSEKTLDDVLQFINKVNVKHLIISGGEPTDHPLFSWFINRIIEKTDPSILFIVSNGIFVDDKQKTDEMRELLKNKKITALQITNVEKYYPRHDIVSKVKALDFYNRMVVVNKLADLIMLGRALKNHPKDISFRGPSCSNYYLLSRQGITDFYQMIKHLQDNSDSSFCKPMIDPDGFVHVGEFIDCTKLGHVTSFDPVAAGKQIQSTRPCDKCGTYKKLSYLVRSLIEST